jgi:uncharacterized lipoprotein NlpE involved in copper resistance
MMKKLLVMMFSATLFLAGCGDKDETAGEKLDNAVDATQEAAADAYDASKEAVGDAADKVSDAVDDETDDTETH